MCTSGRWGEEKGGKKRERGAETAVIYRARHGYGFCKADFIQLEADLPAVWNLYNNRSCTKR